jgi:hypothetical protein
MFRKGAGGTLRIRALVMRSEWRNSWKSAKWITSCHCIGRRVVGKIVAKKYS